MAGKPSTTGFGKRRPAQQPSPSSPPPKRSRHVALLMMGTLAVGGGAYALTGPENCEPASPGVATPGQPQTQASCASRGSSTTSGHGYGRYSHFSFFGGDSSNHSSTSGATESGGVSRGGFGAFAHAFGFSGRS